MEGREGGGVSSEGEGDGEGEGGGGEGGIEFADCGPVLWVVGVRRGHVVAACRRRGGGGGFVCHGVGHGMVFRG